MDLLDGLRAFVATAQTGSFTKAAARLGVSNRLTSKYVADLEARLGVRLLQRTTRKVGLTPSGEDLLARAPMLLEDIDDMFGAVTEDSRGFSGILRVSAPVTFGEVYVVDLLNRFAAPHPELIIDLRLNDAYVDLARAGVDLAFRVGTPSLSALKARKLGEIRAPLVCSPDYLRQHPEPKTPEDLVHHHCIVDTNRRIPRRWVFHGGDQEVVVNVPSRFMVNSARAACDLAVAGRGIANCPDFVLGDHLATGKLVEILPTWVGQGSMLSAVYLEGRALPRKTRALIDFAAKEIGKKGSF